MRLTALAACAAAASLAVIMAVQPAQAQQISNERIGNLLGGIAGGLLGAQVGGGSGRIVGAAVGAVGGAVVGGEIAKGIDARDQPAKAAPRHARPVRSYDTPTRHADVLLIANRNANVRRGPSTDTAIVDRLERGERVRRLGEAANGDWVLVDIDGRRVGYVYAPLLSRQHAAYAG